MKREFEPNRGLITMTARRNRAVSRIILFVLGLVGCVGLLGADWYFTALPLFAIMPQVIAWVISILSSPIEAAGVELLTETYAKHELSQAEYVFWMIVTPLVMITDILTNIMGLYGWAQMAGTQMTELYGVVIVIIGIIMAAAEFLIAGFIIAMSRRIAEYREATAFLEKHSPVSASDAWGKGLVVGPPSRRSRRPQLNEYPGQPPGQHPESRKQSGRFE